MRKWGIVITIFYALVVVGLLTPVFWLLVVKASSLAEYSRSLYGSWQYWVWIAFLVSGQALLLFLSVDTSHKRLKPRQHIAVSIILTALLLAILTFAAVVSLSTGIYGEDFLGQKILFGLDVGEGMQLIIALFVYLIVPWTIWGILFYIYLREVPGLVTRLMSWLLKGSVLELLIAVPSHILVRQRHDCSAPLVTSYGIVTGLAIMLLSFGPSVLFLYKKRLDQYKRSGPATSEKEC